MDTLLTDVSSVVEWLKDLCSGLISTVFENRLWAAFFVAPLLFWVIGWALTLYRNVEFGGWIGEFQQRRDQKKKDAFANKIFGSSGNEDLLTVTIDGQTYRRKGYHRFHSVKLGKRISKQTTNTGTHMPRLDD